MFSQEGQLLSIRPVQVKIQTARTLQCTSHPIQRRSRHSWHQEPKVWNDSRLLQGATFVKYRHFGNQVCCQHLHKNEERTQSYSWGQDRSHWYHFKNWWTFLYMILHSHLQVATLVSSVDWVFWDCLNCSSGWQNYWPQLSMKIEAARNGRRERQEVILKNDVCRLVECMLPRFTLKVTFSRWKAH